MEISLDHINQFLKKCRNANWAGVFYSLPPSRRRTGVSKDQNNFQFLLQDLNEIQLSSKEEFIFHPFDHQIIPKVVLKPQFKNEEAIQQLEQNIDPSPYWSLPILKEFKTTEKKEYELQFEKYISAIQQGYCSKAILSTITKKEIPADYGFGEFILRLRKEYPQAFIYLFSSPITGTWIGATPETFLKWNGNEISTMSLAGTKKEESANFLFGDKEKNEQKIVTEYIEQIFTEYFGEVEIEKPVEFSYGEMVHLITRVAAKTSPDFTIKDFMRLTQQFHPTPAVGGYPKQAAINLIANTEKHSRLYYSGYLGPVNDSSAELAVNLRCMTMNGDSLFVFAGGGITKDSNLEAEWAETRLKAQALLKFL